MTREISEMTDWSNLDFDFPAWTEFEAHHASRNEPESKFSATLTREAIKALEAHNKVVITGAVREELDSQIAVEAKLYGE